MENSGSNGFKLLTFIIVHWYNCSRLSSVIITDPLLCLMYKLNYFPWGSVVPEGAVLVFPVHIYLADPVCKCLCLLLMQSGRLRELTL